MVLTNPSTLPGTGAMEQVAPAVRLAIAELFASDHDGCLTEVFDAAFASSDPERLHALHAGPDCFQGAADHNTHL